MRFRFWQQDAPPTLLFVTHAKAGSTWIDGILRTLFGRHVGPREYQIPDFTSSRHKVFTVFMSRDEVLSRPEIAEARRFVVLRDLRDTLVSRYFSLRQIHKAEDPAGKIAAIRVQLRAMNEEEGLLHVLEDAGMVATARIQSSWVGAGDPVHRYEDLLADDVTLFTRLFVEELALALTPARIAKAVLANRFESVFGRPLGVPDATSHGRQGTPGDWRNHFTPRLAERFHQLHGELLLASGYEVDPDWFKAGFTADSSR